MSDEPLIVPAYVEAEPGNFKPVLSCGPEELIDAAVRYRNAAVAYRNRAHEYRQFAEALASLASHRLREPGGEPPPVQLVHVGVDDR
jgi:hypothetical protein